MRDRAASSAAAATAAPTTAAARGTSARWNRRKVRHGDDELVLDLAALKVRRLSVAEKLNAAKRQRLFTAGVGTEGHVLALLERFRLAVRVHGDGRVSRDAVPAQLDILKIRAVVTERFESPLFQVVRDVRRRQTIAFREDLTALQFIGRQIAQPLLHVGLADLRELHAFGRLRRLCEKAPRLRDAANEPDQREDTDRYRSFF